MTSPEIAKTISLYDSAGRAILIVISGNQRIDGPKFKSEFGAKAKMVSFDDVQAAVGHPPGGVCPFATKEGVRVFLDISLKKFSYIYTACGTENSVIKLSPDELEVFSSYEKWVDVTKD